ncbi:MAG: DEAD/DEAH box helicase [Theionarchaea archaeon]|nr:DEAD/DEAH box helicase [Theionarchaea archaeon]
MLIIRKTTRKKPELEIYNITNGKKIYYLTLREEKNTLRPHKFRTEDELFQPKKAVQLFKSKKIFLSKDDETLTIKKELEELFKYLQTSYEWIDLCRHCFIEGKISQNPQYVYRGEEICRNCALQEVRKELKFRKVTIPVEPILDRLKNVDKVIKLFDPKFAKTQDTLYDVVEGKLPETLLSIDDIDIPLELKEILKKEITHLLPIQQRAIEAGLLNRKNLLIVSATASGKTLIAELAGLKSVYNKKKFLFLVPLVALANQKYEDFKRRYSHCTVSIRVGMSRIKTAEDLYILDTDINADIIIGTYEGIDFLIRSNVNLKDVGCIVIDEVHMLSDPERGSRLDGMISRLRALHPHAQFLGLSATVGNPQEIGKELGTKTILYEERPVPLERHIVLTSDKKETIRELIEKEWKEISLYGYHGQTILFTNSRRNCENLASFLRSQKIKAEAYHAGLPYIKRKTVELNFWNQNIQAVCCTAALSAGVDFPSSCVIFDSYKMGIEPLTKREFHQMLGRAGRPLYHTLGKVYLLVEPFSEDDTVLNLLEGPMEEVDVIYTEDQELENALAAKACNLSLESVNTYALWTLTPHLLTALEKYQMTKDQEITEYGRAVSVSFLSVKEAEFIRNSLNNDILDTVVQLESFNNVYLTQRLKSRLELDVDTLFSGSCLEALTKNESGFPVILEFFVCDCKESPYCDHPKLNISRKICKLRMDGLSPSTICKVFRQEYALLLYPGDVFSYLDAVVHKIEAVERIAGVHKRNEVVKKAETLRKSIEG